MPEKGPSLVALGWNDFLERSLPDLGPDLHPGRITEENKHYYKIISPDGELTAQVSGKLLHETRAPADLPKVGDWVVFTPLPLEDKATIHGVLPRRTKPSRKGAGREVEEQVLVTNIDAALIVQALDRTFNAAVLLRHLVMVLESGAKPIVVLNKADLCSDISQKVTVAQGVAAGAPILVVSAKTTDGVSDLAQHIRPAETVVFVGCSGVGKSTLINDLYGEEIQTAYEVRARDSKGRHTTSWRELIMLPNGGMVIDTPGMREFQMWTAGEGMREAFADLESMALQCHFRGCTHTVERRCAILEAVASGQVPRERYDRFLKLQKELTVLQGAQSQRASVQRRRETRLAQRALDQSKQQGDE